MCGIAGIIQTGSDPAVRLDAVQRMCQAMLHRGPDDEGIETHGAATLGMRRLAIFDPAHGHQPMTTADGRFTLIFNGAIYNFKALRDELRAAGRPFHTECDTEVLLQAYAQWGEACLKKLRGMFAFAAWDNHAGTLFLARDAFGIKPLYYQHDGSRLIFASELNALIASGLVAAELDPVSVTDYLSWLSVPAPRTIYRRIFSLRPGESASFRGAQLEIKPAWSFNSIAPNTPICKSRAEFVGELRSRLEETVRAHVVADVPVGAFLSGGLDSAVVTGLMSRAGGGRLKTFSIGFSEAEFSEADSAAETARHFGTEHHPILLTGAEIAGDIETLVGLLDQPTGDGLNTYYVSRAARAGGVTVALSGLGGDELFGGYPSFRNAPRLHQWLKYWRWLPGFAQNPLLNSLRQRGTAGRKLADILKHARSFNEIASLQRQVFSTLDRPRLLHSDVRHLAETREVFHPELHGLRREVHRHDRRAVVSAWELRTYMADVLLRDSDVMSMRNSLELRVPFVDRPLVEWLWQQPAEFRFEPGKRILADAVRDLLPPGLLERKKRGFSLPFPVWMKRELKPFLDHTFSDESVRHSGLFDRTATQQVWQDFLAGNDSRQWSRVWSLAMLLAFAGRRERAKSPQLHRHTTTLLARPATGQVEIQSLPTDRAVSRLLLLTPEIFSAEGGISRVMRHYLKALCELAVPSQKIRLLTLNDPLLDSSDLRTYANEQLEAWQGCGGDKLKFIRAALRLSRGCDRILCGHVGQLPVAYAASLLNRKLRYSLIAHGIEVWRPFKASERLALRRAERIYCVSDYTRRQILSHCPLPAEKFTVVANALDPGFPIGPAQSAARIPNSILCISRLSQEDGKYKGVDHLISALPLIREKIPGATLRIIGQGDDVPRLHRLVNNLDLGQSVIFTGFIDDHAMREELHRCSLFALPSSREGFGLVYLEAMACGRPCLGAAAGGVPEVITPETGVLVEPGNVPQIAATCVAALQRDWPTEPILARAEHFSYVEFRSRLRGLLFS